MPNPGEIIMKNVGIFASDSSVSIDAAFLNMADYKKFNEAYHVDCRLQVEEAKALGIKGDTKPKVINIAKTNP